MKRVRAQGLSGVRVSLLYTFIIGVIFVVWAVILFPDLPVPAGAYLTLAGGIVLAIILLNSLLMSGLARGQGRERKTGGITPNALLAETEALALALTRGREIAVLTDCQDALNGLVLRRDGAVLRRIVTGLLYNALRQTERGTITILFSLAAEGGESRLEVCVADTGRGLEPEAVEALSGPFPFHPSCPELSIARALTDSRGGRMEIESTAGKGSVVTATVTIGEIA